MRNFYWLACLIVAFSLVFSACAAPKAAPAPTPTTEKPGAAASVAPQLTKEQQLIEGAKKEGEVVLWTQSWPQDLAVRFKAAFEAKYPFLTLKTWDASIGDLVVRLTTEAKAGRFSADLVICAETDINTMVNAGVFKEYDWPNAGWSGQPSTKYFMNFAQGSYFPVYNTNLLTAAELPKSFDDMKSPRWIGRSAISTSGLGIPLYTAYLFGKGKVDWEKSESYWRTVVASNKPRIVSNFTGPNGMLAAGEFALMFMSPNDPTTILMRRGAPVAPIALEAAPSYGWSMGFPKTSIHPYAAQLLLNYFAGPEGNLIYADVKSLTALNPEAMKKSNINMYYQKFGLNMVPMPSEIYTPENTQRAGKFWTEEMPRAAGR